MNTYTDDKLYGKTIFVEGEWSDLLKETTKWLDEQVVVKATKPKIIQKREFFVLDIVLHYDGEGYHVATIYYSKDMPK